MKRIDITNGIMRIDTNTETFDIQKIQNRRFMYNPQTGTLILGIQTQCNDFFYKKVTEYRRIGIRSNFNEFVSGWVGSGKTGVIDFTPSVPTAAKSIFNKALDTLIMFYRNNANMKTERRGFGNTKPQPLENIITEREVELMAKAQATKAPEKSEPSRASVQAIELSGETPYEKLSEILKKLEDGVKDIFNGDKYAEYLACMSKFHNYSFRNSLLILMQKPDASMVAGFGAWRDNHKRTVKRGERGIKIIAPSSYKTKKQIEKINPATNKPIIGWDGKPLTEEKEVTIPTFRVATVFDLSQTEGEPLPSLGVDELTGNVADFKKFYAALEKISPMPIGYEDIDTGAKGYCNFEEQRIAVKNGMSEVQQLKTLIHEIAHAKLHNILKEKSTELTPEEQKNNRTMEVEAESVAYTVCQRYGIDTSDYSFGYVAGWSKDKELPELNASLDTIQKTANEIILGIDEYYKELAKDIEQTEQETDYTQFTGWDFNGGYAAINTDANYLQVFFNEKPDDNIRAELKANGFHWEPKIKAWQQPLTGEVLNAADKVEYIRPLDGTLPSEFQKRNEEPAKIAEQDGFSELSDADAADGAKVFEPEDNSKDTPTIDELEAKAKNGEPVAIMDIIAANEAEKVKKGKTPSKNETSKKKPSIKKQLAEAKAQADKQPQKSEKVKNAALEV